MWSRLHPIARDTIALLLAAFTGCLIGLIEQVLR